jgi:hypothetical protein
MAPPPRSSQVRYEKRTDGGSLETANLRERDAFNGDRKQVRAPGHPRKVLYGRTLPTA